MSNIATDTKKSFFPIKISASIPRGDFRNEYELKVAVKDWKELYVESDEDLKRIVTSYPYGIFKYVDENSLKTRIDTKGVSRKESQRQGKHVVSINAELVIFDVDSDITLNEAIQKLERENIKYAIVTTKRHQKEGKGDRFRVILPVNLLLGDNISLVKEKFPGTAIMQKKIRDKRIRDYLTTMTYLSTKFFPKEFIEEKDVINKDTGEVKKVKERVEGTLVDKGPFSPGGKFHPSPKDAIFISTLNNPLKETFQLTKPMIREIKKIIATEDDITVKRTIALKKAALRNKEIGTYRWFKENKEHRTIVNIELLKCIDLGELIMHYEYRDNVIPEESNLPDGKKLIHIHGEDGAAYHINTDDEGRYFYFDYNSKNKGSIIDYLVNRFPKDFGDGNVFTIAKAIIRDFPNDEHGLNKRLIMKNPAYYLEDYIDRISKGKPVVALKKKKEIKEIGFSKDYSQLNVVTNSGWKEVFKLEKEEQEMVKSILEENITKDLSIQVHRI